MFGGTGILLRLVNPCVPFIINLWIYGFLFCRGMTFVM